MNTAADHRLMLPNLVSFLKLYLPLPCPSCSAERGFSSLRRIQTYLRSTMTADPSIDVIHGPLRFQPENDLFEPQTNLPKNCLMMPKNSNKFAQKLPNDAP